MLVNVDFVYTTGLRRQVAINNMGCCDVVTYEGSAKNSMETAQNNEVM